MKAQDEFLGAMGFEFKSLGATARSVPYRSPVGNGEAGNGLLMRMATPIR